MIIDINKWFPFAKTNSGNPPTQKILLFCRRDQECIAIKTSSAFYPKVFSPIQELIRLYWHGEDATHEEIFKLIAVFHCFSDLFLSIWRSNRKIWLVSVIFRCVWIAPISCGIYCRQFLSRPIAKPWLSLRCCQCRVSTQATVSFLFNIKPRNVYFTGRFRNRENYNLYRFT